MAILQFVLAIFLWFFLLGWAIHLLVDPRRRALEAAGGDGLSKYWCRWYEPLTDAVR